jgi:pseudouridine kinase
VSTVLCAGGAVLDRHLHLLGPAVARTSNPARAAASPGGVARNVAENLALLGVPVRLCSRVGDDDAGALLLRGLVARGVDVRAVAVGPGESTAQYVAVLDPGGDLVLGVAAMDVLAGVGWAEVAAAWPADPGDWVFLDCNLAGDVLAAALARARRDGTRVVVDAVSTPKVVRLPTLAGIAVLVANLDEARALLGARSAAPTPARDPLDDAADLAVRLVAEGAGSVVLTAGARGAVVADGTGGARAVAAPAAAVVDVPGAGDALVAAALARLVAGDDLLDAVRTGVRAAALTVAVPLSVRPDLAAALGSVGP